MKIKELNGAACGVVKLGVFEREICFDREFASAGVGVNEHRIT